MLACIAGKSGVVRAVDPDLGERYLYCDGQASLLFTENETNTQRLVGVQNRTPFVKDAINNYVVHGPGLTMLLCNSRSTFVQLKGLVNAGEIERAE